MLEKNMDLFVMWWSCLSVYFCINVPVESQYFEFHYKIDLKCGDKKGATVHINSFGISPVSVKHLSEVAVVKTLRYNGRPTLICQQFL